MSDTLKPHPTRPSAPHTLTPDDPLYTVVAAVKLMQQQAHRELAELVRKLAEDIAATSVLAEQAARAKAEAIITQAGDWGSTAISKAGADVVATLLTERMVRDVNHSAFLSRLWWSVVVAALLGGGWVAGLALLAGRYYL